MLIEKISFTKKGAEVTLGGQVYSFDADCAFLYRIKKGDELDENTLASMLDESDLISCKKYLFSQIEKYSKTEKGYRDKLYEKGFRPKNIKIAVSKAKELGYIDDGRFAERYYERNKDKKGIVRIKNELRQKGVRPEYLEFLKEEKQDENAILILAEKFMKRREKTPEEKVKLMRHLAAKGFSYDEIIRATNKTFSSDED